MTWPRPVRPDEGISPPEWRWRRSDTSGPWRGVGRDAGASPPAEPPQRRARGKNLAHLHHHETRVRLHGLEDRPERRRLAWPQQAHLDLHRHREDRLPEGVVQDLVHPDPLLIDGRLRRLRIEPGV